MKKRLLTLLALPAAILLVLPAIAVQKEHYPDVTVEYRDSCELVSVEYDWDFAVSDQGFTTTSCDPQGGEPVWQWGAETVIPDAPANVWATILNGNYPNNAGDGLVSPSFVVTPDAHLMEVFHYVHIESNYDGGNVKVGGEVIHPTNEYTHPIINESESFYAFCVDGQPGYSGNGFNGPSQEWLVQCFDLSEFMGQEIQLQFDFGSDSSVIYPGWYLGYVKVGTDEGVIATEAQSWSGIKGIFR